VPYEYVVRLRRLSPQDIKYSLRLVDGGIKDFRQPASTCAITQKRDSLYQEYLGQIPDRGRDFTLRHHLWGPASLLSHPMDIKDSFTGLKWPELEGDHSLPFSAEIKNARSFFYYLIRLYDVVHKHRDKFRFSFHVFIYYLTPRCRK
jgi:hypothetical protein